MMKNFEQKGITFIEISIVLAVVGILVAVVLPSFSKIKENQILKNGVQDIISSLGKARSQTLASLNSSSYGAHFESDKVIIFTGTTFSAGASSNATTNIISPASISLINLAGGVTDVYFERLSGAPSTTGAITISTPSFSKVITISTTGAVSVN